MDYVKFEEHLIWAEGEELKLYKDSVGIWTIGVGHNIEEKGISLNISRMILKEDMDEMVRNCRNLAYWNALDAVRQLVVADMVFNLGLTRFLGFVNLNKALAAKDYQLAAREMKDSKWYVQVGRRAVKLCAAMSTGEWNA